MKNLFLLIFITMLCGISAYAQQVPQGMRYQAVARDLDGQVINEQAISLQIHLRAGERGEVLYTEQHQVTTNSLGLFGVTVGSGKTIFGEFASIPWSLADIWLDIEMDDQGGKRFVTINSSQLLAVPYAFHAGTAGSLTGEESELGKNGPQFYWSINGNVGTFPTNHYMGTRDYKDLLFGTNGIRRMTITRDGDIDIGGSLNVGDNLTVANNATIGNDLRVDRDASIGQDLLVERNTQMDGVLEVDGTLGVDGITTLRNPAESTTKDNGSLVVEGGVGIERNINIGGNSSVSGNSSVTGNSTVGGNSAVTGNSTVGGTLGVDGIATFNNTTESTTKDNGAVIIEGGVGIEKNINIGGNSSIAGNSSVGGNSFVTGNSTVNGTTGLNGQVTINANVGGGDASYGAYPLRVEGSDQGVAIKLNPGAPVGANNFVTFFNGSGTAVGGIEGQNFSEKEAEPQNIFQRTILAATLAKSTVALGLSAIPTCVVGVVASCGPSLSTIAIAVADEVLAIANLAAFEIFLTQNIGVTYSSGSADYAEWLERAYPEEQISAGDIVAVNGGKITKYTKDAQQFMAISTNPAVLGNVPADGNVSNMEKVAFMGQIPVKVRGIVLTGDYILPSELHDGIGIAVSPSEITAEQYRKIVGVAWSNSFRQDGISYINMAIGLNSNDIATLVSKQEKKITEMERKYKSLEERLIALEKGTNYITDTDGVDFTEIIPSEAPAKEKTREEILAASMPKPYEITDEKMKEVIAYLEFEYNRRGIDIASHPGLHRLFTDMDYQSEVIKKTLVAYEANYENIMANYKD